MKMKQVLSILLVVGIVAGMFAPFAMMPALADDSTERGTGLEVYPERTLDADVDESEDDGIPLYETEGNYVELTVDEIDDHKNITNYGIEGSTGSLTYDADTDRFLFDADETDGSYVLYFYQHEEVEVDNETTVEEVRYESIVRVDNTDQTVVDRGSYEELESDAEDWRTWEDGVQELFGENADVEGHTDSAYQFLRWRSDGFAILGEDVTAVLIIVTTTWGGRFLLLGLFLTVAISSYSVSRYVNWREKNDPEERDVFIRESELDKREAEQALQGVDLEDVFNDPERADLYREVTAANNFYDWFMQVSQTISYEFTRRLKLNVMDAEGYEAIVSTDSDGVVTSARVEREPEPSEKEEVVELVNADDDLLEALVYDEVVSQFNPSSASVTPAEVEDVEIDDEPIESLEHLISHVDDTLVNGPIETKQVATEWLEAFQFIRQHPVTDRNGNLNPLRLVLNDLAHALRVVSDKHEVPLVREQAHSIEFLLETADVETDADNLINTPEGE